jgi:hypothetical protein
VLCNGRHPVTITHHMYTSVCNWLLSETARHLEPYYHVRQGKPLWINGWRLNSWEPVFPDVQPDILLGTQGTALRHIITDRNGGIINEPIPTLH